MKTLEERLAAIEEKLGIAETKPEYVWVATVKGFNVDCGLSIRKISVDALSEDADSVGDYKVLNRDVIPETFINEFFVDSCHHKLKARLHEMVDVAFEEAMGDE